MPILLIACTAVTLSVLCLSLLGWQQHLRSDDNDRTSHPTI